MNFTQLQSKVASWLNRSDLTAQVPDFINMAMHDLERNWNYRSMERRLTTSSADAYLTMPTNYKDTKWLKVIDPVSGEYMPMEKKSSDFSISKYPFLANQTGMPVMFSTLSSQSEILVRPTPNQTYSYEGVMFVYSADLSGDTDTNDWTDTNWECLLFGALTMAAPFLGGDDRLKTWQMYYQNSFTSLRNAESKEDIGGSPPKGNSAYVV